MKTILITGADGYLGGHIGRALLTSTDAKLLLWIRARDRDQFLSRRDRLERTLLARPGRLQIVGGELSADRPFDGIPQADVDLIIHTAGATRFNLELENARNINVDGSRKLMRFAAGCPRLERVLFLSSVYASGLAPGPVAEGPLCSGRRFANHYEWSKWAAENCALEEFPELPSQILRVATVMADDETGRVSRRNALHNTLKLFHGGLLPMVPGDPTTPVYLVTAQFVADAATRLLERSISDTRIVHVAHRRENSLSLAELVDIAFQTFCEDARFRMRRVLKPLLCDLETFRLLVKGVENFSSRVLHQALASVQPFAPQLFVPKDVMNARLVSALDGYRAPDPTDLFRSICRDLLRTRWRRISHVT